MDTFKTVRSHHIANVIDASTKLTRTMSDVVDADEKGSPSSRSLVRNEIKLVRKVERGSRSQLRNLAESFLFKDLSHFLEDLRERKIILGSLFVLVEDIEQSGSASSTRTSMWIRQLELLDVGDIRRSLSILASRDHANVSLQFLGLVVLERPLFDPIKKAAHGVSRLRKETKLKLYSEL
jgi:hypothetical protein